MAYREDAREDSLKDRFWYGPFRPVLEVLGFAVMFVILMLVAVSTLRQSTRLDCERSTGVCTYRRANILGQRSVSSFPIADVRDVRYVQGSGKQRDSGECVLVFRSGGDFRLPSQPTNEARSQHARLQRFFVVGKDASLAELRQSGFVLNMVMILLTLVVGGVALSSFLQAAPFRVEVFADRIWLPKQRRSIDVSRVTKIAVETRVETRKLRRVAIISPDHVELLTPEFRGGWSTHEVAAARLGKALGVPVDLGGDLDDARPAPAVSATKVPRVAILGGAAIALIVVGGVVLTLFESRTQGTLELDCQGRCRFGQMECLPGGSVSMGLPPGTHTVETWAPDDPARWKKNEVALEIGQTRRFVCPPTK